MGVALSQWVVNLKGHHSAPPSQASLSEQLTFLCSRKTRATGSRPTPLVVVVVSVAPEGTVQVESAHIAVEPVRGVVAAM